MTLGKLYLMSAAVTFVVTAVNIAVRSKEDKKELRDKTEKSLTRIKTLSPTLGKVLGYFNSDIADLIFTFIPIINLGMLYMGIKEVIDAFRR